MRTDATANYIAMSMQKSRDLRLVVSINFGTEASPDLVYFTSHADTTIAGATVYARTLKDASSLTQKLNPLDGRSEIGAMSFELVDVSENVTNVFASKQEAGKGLRGKFVRLYSGYSGLAWADYRLEQTQVVAKSVTFQDGLYKVNCQDIQREQRKDIFAPVKTRLALAVPAVAKNGFGEAITATVTVYDTSEFKPNWHGPSYSLQSQTMAAGTLASPRGLYIFRIKYQNGWEYCAATGKTATTFTNVFRGLFGTKIVSHTIDGSAVADNGPEVEEVRYLELPTLKAMYALYTGKLIGQPHTLDAASGTYKDELPAGWHLGIDPAWVDLDAFISNASVSREDLTDLYRTADDTGFVLRFDNAEKVDGKQFIEKELCLPSGVVPLIKADGKISVKRISGVLSTSSYVDVLDATNVLDYGELTHDLDGCANHFSIDWAWLDLPEGKKFYRNNTLADAVSEGIHGEAKPLALQFKGLHAARHTENTIRSAFNALRDRHSGPPERITLKLSPHKNALEVGDLVRVKLDQVRDYNNAIRRLDRTMEIQSIQIDQSSQTISVNLFGSSRKAAPISYITQTVLPDGWYGSGAALWPQPVSGGVSTATANIPAGVYYFNGDLTINHNVTINGTVWLRVKGTLTINALISGKGRSGATGGAYFGDAEATGDVHWYLSHGTRTVSSFRGPVNKGQTSKVPALNVENNGGVLAGVPAALNGTKGPTGGLARSQVTGNAPHTTLGGAGGNGGAGFGFIGRGLVFGAGGYIDTSGNDGSNGAAESTVLQSGSGAGGLPGACIVLFDGKPAVVPVFSGRIIAARGACSLSPGNRPAAPTISYGGSAPRWRSYYEGMQAEDMWDAAFEWGFVPEAKTAYPDYSLSPTAEPTETNMNGVVFVETFSSPYALESWEEFDGIGDLRITTDGEVTTGGQVLSVGNNAGNDMAWRVHRNTIPFSSTKLYRIRARAKRTAGSGVFYLGICGVAADGSTLVNITGSNSYSAQHYFGAASAAPGSTFQEYVGYFKGLGSPNGSGAAAPTWSSPGVLHASVRYLRPMFIANYSGAAGTTIIDYIKIEEVPIDSLGRPTELFSGDTNATNGAPAGTLVGGVDSSLVARPRPNLVRNPCGYLANRYWSSDNSLVPLITESYNEGKYWYVTSGQVPTYKNFYTEAISVSAGETYTLSFRGYRDSSTNATIGIYYYNSGGGQTGGVTVPITVSGGWASYSVTGAAPAGTTFARIVCSFDAMAGWGYAWTKIKLEFGSAPSPFTMERSTNLVSLAEGDNVVDRYSDYLFRDSGDATPLRTIINRINNSGRPANQRFLRAFHAPATQAAKAGGALSAADAGSTATITIPAWSLETDVGTISYNSGTITGLSFSTKYWVYCTDADLNGGAVTYVASTDYKAPSQNADRVYVGTITTPADGGGGTGGGAGGGDYCVAVSAWLPDVGGGEPWRAAFAAKGKTLWVLNDTDDGILPWPIRSVDFAHSDCVELVTDSGIRLTVSVSTPITLKGGRIVLAPTCKGLEVPVLDGQQFRWEEVIEVNFAGLQQVARIHADQLTFAAGDQKHRYILTHNPTQKP